LDYAPFGEPLVNVSAGRQGDYTTPYQFTGHERDEETGFSYAHARYIMHGALSGFTSVDDLAEKFPYISGYAYVFWNPIQYNDPTGNTPEERLLALQIAEGLIGTAYNSALPKNDRVKYGQLDCSGLVRFAIMQNFNIGDPFNSNVKGGGVTKTISNTRQVKIDGIRDGDLVVIKSGSNENGHIGFVKDIVRDADGKVTQYTMLHSETAWTNEKTGQSGGGNINETTIKVGSGRGYAKDRYNHRFFQWDTPGGENNTNSASETNLCGRQLYFSQGKPEKFSEKLMNSRISIVNDIGRIAKALGL
jgi:RHS repeat-associated protein